MAPATRPMTMVASGEVEAQLALPATRPAIQPLALREASGLR